MKLNDMIDSLKPDPRFEWMQVFNDLDPDKALELIMLIKLFGIDPCNLRLAKKNDEQELS